MVLICSIMMMMTALVFGEFYKDEDGGEWETC